MNAHILDAATRMILQHGIKGTTMSVFADEAGVSRQTLYVRFPNKEALLRGCIRKMWEDAQADIAERLQTVKTLRETLEIIFDNITIKPRALVDEATDSAELFEGTHRYAAAELELVFAEIVELIAKTLSPYRSTVEGKGMRLEDYAKLIQISAEGIKRQAADGAETAEMIDALITSVLAVVEPA